MAIVKLSIHMRFQTISESSLTKTVFKLQRTGVKQFSVGAELITIWNNNYSFILFGHKALQRTLFSGN